MPKQKLLPAEKRPVGRPKGPITIGDRYKRLQMMTAAQSLFPSVIAFWAEVLEAQEMVEKIKKIGGKAVTVTVPKYSTADRFEATDRIMAYAYGRPAQTLEASVLEQRKQILEVRWLPPDPADHSKVIEPEPD
jgi:hypothetical protein